MSIEWEKINLITKNPHISISKAVMYIPATYAKHFPDRKANLVKHDNMMAFVGDKDGEVLLYKQSNDTAGLKCTNSAVMKTISNSLNITNPEKRTKLKTWVDDGYVIFMVENN